MFTEFRNLTNGLPVGSNKLIGALEYFGLDTIGAVYKQYMIDLILRGPPWTEEEWQAILDYCAGDVYALERLLPAMLPHIDLPRALFRGRYMGNLAVVESHGVPVDVALLSLTQKHWTDIQDDLIAKIDADYGVYDGRTFREERFEAFFAPQHSMAAPRKWTSGSGRQQAAHLPRDGEDVSDHLAAA